MIKPRTGMDSCKAGAKREQRGWGQGPGGGAGKKICLDCMMCEIGCCFLLSERETE